MNILYLDTSSKYLSLAVAEDHKILRQTHRLLDRKHSLQLVPMIDKLLRKAKLSLKKIDGFCVGRGPGSFTGLRIGITTIKGLAFVINKPVVAIPSLDILAQNARPFRNRTQICTIVDAKQNKVYACLYQACCVRKKFPNRAPDAKIRRKSGYLLLPLCELLDVDSLVPLYLYPKTCQIKKRK
jgi:tRNA threonylcarbamoyladenosine biosynthesis protein TsaB